MRAVVPHWSLTASAVIHLQDRDHAVSVVKPASDKFGDWQWGFVIDEWYPEEFGGEFAVRSMTVRGRGWNFDAELGVVPIAAYVEGRAETLESNWQRSARSRLTHGDPADGRPAFSAVAEFGGADDQQDQSNTRRSSLSRTRCTGRWRAISIMPVASSSDLMTCRGATLRSTG